MARWPCREKLEELYRRLNRRCFVHPDPLEFLYQYEACKDRELVALIASSLAYGRVNQILSSISKVLKEMGPHPAAFIRERSKRELEKTFSQFKHRFTTSRELLSLLINAKEIEARHGSLFECFKSHLKEEDETFLPALCGFTEELRQGLKKSSLLPDPRKGSASKRLNLLLRWMVRQDEVDPGCWQELGAHRLIVPLDTHMHKIGLELGLSKRRAADLKTALEITSAFRKIEPEDPVRYDFALTRMGICSELSLEDCCLLGN